MCWVILRSHSAPTVTSLTFHSHTALTSALPLHPTGCFLRHFAKTKSNCSFKVSEKDRISSKLSSAPPTPPSNDNPPESRPEFDDASWELVDAPHDMLIAQGLSENANNKMGYYYRNSGWYRKHFALPVDWEGSTIFIYIEGIFHRTTFWLNGKPLAFHPQGYTSFWLRIDNASNVNFGPNASNILAIYVDASTGTGWW